MSNKENRENNKQEQTLIDLPLTSKQAEEISGGTSAIQEKAALMKNSNNLRQLY